MPQMYEVKQGDTLISIAYQFGFRNWRTIWDHDRNVQLREKRLNPQILSPRDQVFVPDKRPEEHRCITNRRHTFTVASLKSDIRIVLQNEDGEPYARKEYKLTVDGKVYRGQTDANGLLEEEVPANAKEGELVLWPNDDDPSEILLWSLDIGYLDPISEISGIQARLNNLGYECGEANGELNETTRGALRAFQRDNGLDVTGELDDATRSKLGQLHDKV
ncbi:peptidoglycan-binding protein [Candidatus Poribacteria bacterium]